MNFSSTYPTQPLIKTCTAPGCAEPSNGIAPYDRCSAHYREYMEWLSRRQMLETSLAVGYAQSIPAHINEALDADEPDPEIAQHMRALDHVGYVLDLLGERSDRSRFRKRS